MTTLIGIIAGVTCVVVGILLSGDLISFWDPTSVFVTIGGTFSALVISFPVKQIKDTLKSLKIAFGKDTFDPTQNIKQIIDLANIARKEGLLALENLLEDIKNPFLRKGIMLIVDGSNSELVKSVMETEIYYMAERHDRCCTLLNAGAAFSPAFGMIGTLIGLIVMLVNLQEMDTLGQSMSVALVTTFYGCILANLFFSPLAKKLKTYSAYEQMQSEMILEGILSIQEGENPRLIRDKLDAFISSTQSSQLDALLQAGKSSDDSAEG